MRPGKNESATTFAQRDGLPRRSLTTGVRTVAGSDGGLSSQAARPRAIGPTRIGPSSTPVARRLMATNSRTYKALSRRELLMVVTRLSIMLRSGVDIADAVRSIANRAGSPNVGHAMEAVYSQLESGSSFSSALDAQRNRFGGVMVATVAAGEASGKLVDVLGRLTRIIEDDLRLHNSIRSAISYPIVLLAVTSMVMFAMMFFVLPQFGSIYESSQTPTPAVTQIMLDVSRFCREKWWVVVGGTIASAVLWVQAIKSPLGRRKIDQFMLKSRWMRGIFSPLISGRVFRLQGSLLASGVAMVDVLHLTRHSVKNSCFTELCDQIENTVMRGDGMSKALRDSPIIPIEAAEMIATAEANGQLGGVLQTVGEFYETQGEQKLRDAVKIAEPAIIVCMGLVIGTIVLSVMLPLLDLSTANGM